MGRTRFRVMIGLLAFAHLVAASELGGLIGFVAIWAMIFAIVPIEAAAGLIPGLQKNVSLPSWTPEAVLSAAGLAIIAAAARKLVKAGAARRAGDHNEARRRAFSGLSIASVPTCLILSVKALADAWP